MNSFAITATGAVYTARLCYRKSRKDARRVYIATSWAIALVVALCILLKRWVDRVVDESLDKDPPRQRSVRLRFSTLSTGDLAASLRISDAMGAKVQRRSPHSPAPALALVAAPQREVLTLPSNSDLPSRWAHSHTGLHRPRWRSHPSAGPGELCILRNCS